MIIQYFSNGNPGNRLVRGALGIVMGCALMLVPGLSVRLVLIVMGLTLLAAGLLSLYLDARLGGSRTGTRRSMVGGALCAMGGVMALFPTAVGHVFVFVVGALLVLGGLTQIASVLALLRGMRSRWLLTLTGMVPIVGGVALMTVPERIGELLLMLLGALVAAYGVGEVFWYFRLKNAHSRKNVGRGAISDADYEVVDE